MALYSLLQSSRIRGSAGEALPNPFHALHTAGTDLRRGQLCLCSAGPGTGKSAFVLTWALRAKVPTMYFSADSDAFTQLTRSLSVLREWTLEESAEAVLGKSLDLLHSDDLTELPMRFNYSASPTVDDIESSMHAYEEVYGDYPALVVVDNVTNVSGGAGTDDDPFSGLESLMDYLATMARDTEACVVGLHHVTGPYNNGDKPIPLAGIKGQISRVPSLILTLHKGMEDVYGVKELRVSTVKNRGGKADPSGEEFVGLKFDGDRMQITDFGEGENVTAAYQEGVESW